MIETRDEKGADAAATAIGPEVAIAERSASPSNKINNEAPVTGGSSGDRELDRKALDGEDLLERVRQFIRRFVILPSEEAYIAVTLWAAHAHLMDAWQSTPRLAFLSPEPGSGKSRAMEILALLVPRPLLSVNSSSAYILRSIGNQDERPTVLYDEIDTIFGSKAGGNEELRGLINAGYRRGAKAGRCSVMKNRIVPEEFETFSAIAMAGLGNLPDTILSRSIIVRMRKRTKDERCSPYRQRDHEASGRSLSDELSQWAEGVSSRAASMIPSMPPEIADRDADVWEPLIAVGDVAGASWALLARNTALAFIQSVKANPQLTLGVELLSDLKRCFGDEEKVPTEILLERLCADEEAPWGDYNGKKLDPRRLAQLLREYGIRPSTIRMSDDSTPRGYKREQFHDIWKRYLPPETNETNTTSTTDPERSVEHDGSTLAGRTRAAPDRNSLLRSPPSSLR